MPSEFDQQSASSTTANSVNHTHAALQKQSWSVTSLIAAIISSLLKSCFHIFTGKTEIQRLLETLNSARYAEHPQLILKLYKSLLASKNQNLNQITQFLDGIIANSSTSSTDTNLNIDKAVNIISRAKLQNGKSTKTANLEKELEKALMQASNYGVFRQAVFSQQGERYNKECIEHEEMLMDLWKTAAIEPLENRLSKQWQYLGFQGTDPATDFRGMGVLSLKAMLSFVKGDEEGSRNFILKSRHPKTGYPFAMLAINVTAMLVELTKAGNVQLRLALYDADTLTDDEQALAIFYQIFIRVLHDIVDFWDIKDQLDLMDFARVRVQYKSLLESGSRKKINKTAL